MADARVIEVLIQRLPHGEDLPYPRYMTENSVGCDVFCALSKPYTIKPGEITLIPTGIKVAIPEEFEIQIRPRSGLAIKKGITVINSPGTIDPDYRGEVMIGLVNLGRDRVQVMRGDRIAQMVLAPRFRIKWREVYGLPPTSRSSGGFGHTGVRGK